MLIKLNGPFWTAEFVIVNIGDNSEDPAIRALFAQADPGGTDNTKGQIATSAVLLGYVERLKVELTPIHRYGWSRKPDTPVVATNTSKAIREAVETGELCLILAAAEHIDDSTREEHVSSWRCLNGEIPILESLIPNASSAENSDTKRLYQALQLAPFQEAESTPDDTVRTGAARRRAPLAATSSGLSVVGETELPWLGASFTCPFLLTRQVRGPGFELTVEQQGLTPEERKSLQTGWSAIGRSLSENAKKTGARDARSHYNWLTLEIEGAAQLPTIAWHFGPAMEDASLRIRSSESTSFSVLFSDQSSDAVTPAETLARLRLDELVIGSRNGITVVSGQAGIPGDAASGVLKYTVSKRPSAPTADAEPVVGTADEIEYVESFATSGTLNCAVDPIDTARLLRRAAGGTRPKWFNTEPRTPLDSPVLWGFVPLSNGWVQLPVPNLTEQIYLDANLATDDDGNTQSEDEGPHGLLQGAAQFGNTAAQDVQAEHPWNVTLTQCEQFSCSWTLEQQTHAQTGTSSLTMAKIEAVIRAPQLTINGLFWMSTEQPTKADALPTMSTPHGGLEQISITTVAGTLERFPSLITLSDFSIRFSARPLVVDKPNLGVRAHLDNWSFRYNVDDELLALAVKNGVLSEDVFEKNPPWAWLRHPTLPMIQALPMTQSMETAGQPCSSRQLVPFELPLPVRQTPWTIGATENGASNWPVISLETLSPSPRELARNSERGGWPLPLRIPNPVPLQPGNSQPQPGPDLPLVSLSVPGVTYQPDETKPVAEDFPLRLQYRFDVPALDEINAFAELSEPKSRVEKATPKEREGTDADQPLTRDTIGDHWRLLSEKAALAAADAVEAFQLTSGTSKLQNLVEPFVVPASPEMDAVYPGELTIAKLNQKLSGESALKGISGSFGPEIDFKGVADSETYEITAGSMSAVRTDQGIRDQRGLVRKVAERSEKLLETPLQFQKDASGATVRHVTLTSTIAAEKLKIEGGRNWRFWMRDVPFEAAADGDTGTFQRSRTRSWLNEDINDPETLSREHNYLCGYEWRLQNGTGSDSSAESLSLYNLHFFPLTLESVSVVDGTVRKIEINGRLQLPLDGRAEMEDLSNAVRLVFERDSVGSLNLKSVGMIPGEPDGTGHAGIFGEWPLLSTGDNLDTTRICWNSISLSDNKDRLIVKGELRFVLFDAMWRVPISKLEFKSTSPTVKWQHQFAPKDENTADLALQPATVDLTLQLQERQSHSATLHLNTAWGEESVGQLTGQIVYSLTGDEAPQIKGPQEEELGDRNSENHSFNCPKLFDAYSLHRNDVPANSASASDSPLITENAVGNLRSLQLSWRGTLLAMESGDDLSADDTTAEHKSPPDSFLPGMSLDRHSQHATGFAAITFEAVSDERTGQIGRSLAADPIVPELKLRSGFIEMLFPCRWTRGLSDEHSAEALSSSDGNIVISYTAEWSVQPPETTTQTHKLSGWNPSFLMNGSLQITNLISWPAALLEGSEHDTDIKVPSLKSGSRQIRHRIHVLLNQHELPTAALKRAKNGRSIYQLGSPVNLQAVVEHQIIRDRSGEAPLPSRQLTKWAGVQDVRFSTPAQYSQTVASAQGKPLLLRNRERDITAVDYALADSDGSSGAAHDWITSVTAFDSLIVDASAPYWVRKTSLKEKSLTNLQFLPSGIQRASLSHLDDFAPSDPHDPEWTLLLMPFLARLLSESHGTDENPFTSHPAEIAVDGPVSSDVVAFFCGRTTSGKDVRIDVSPFDTAAGRTWAGLDPLSLEENWYRIQNPPRENSFEGVISVMAAHPPAPASLSRAAALKQATTSIRPLWVSEDLPGNNLLVNPEFLGGRHTDEPPVFGAIPENWVVFRFGNTYLPSASASTSELRRAKHREELPRLSLSAAQLLNSETTVLSVRSEAIVTAVEIGQTVKLPPGDYELAMSVFPRATGSMSDITETDLQRGSRVSLFCGPWSTRTFDAAIVRFNEWNRVRLSFTIEEDQELNLGVRLFGEQKHGCNGWQIGNPRLVRLGVLGGWMPGTSRGNRSNETDFSDATMTSGQYAVSDFRTPGTPPKRPIVSGWHLAAAQMRSLLHTNATESTLHAAATILPIHELAHDRLNFMPVGFAVSPYSAISFLDDANEPSHADSNNTSQLSFAELICLNGTKTAMRSVETKLFEQGDDVVKRAQRWARQLHRSMCPESPVAVLRFRHLSKRPTHLNKFPTGTSDDNELQLSYAFNTTLLPESHVPFARRVFSLRAHHSLLRFREGQFGGYRVPEKLRDFELAPPLVNGVQPVYLSQRPGSRAKTRAEQGSEGGTTKGETSNAKPWSWGWSGLRISIQYTERSEAILGARITQSEETEVVSELHDGLQRLWWQSVNHVTQFRAAQKIEGSKARDGKSRAKAINQNTSGLPLKFRAKAIKSLLPVLPASPLPSQKFEPGAAGNGDAHDARLQPVLPGEVTCILVGARPGIMLAMRSQLTQQTLSGPDETTNNSPTSVSGSIPVQHRTPRPVPIPPNRDTKTALRTWAEGGMKDRTVSADTSPNDVVFFDAVGGLDAERIAVRLVHPAGAVVQPTWDGKIRLHVDAHVGATTEAVQRVKIFIGGTQKVFDCKQLSGSEPSFALEVDFADAKEATFKRWSQQEETPIRVSFPRLRAETPAEPPTEPPREVLLSLQSAQPRGLRAPVIPWFVRFEDPEYNRKLASVPATVAGMLPQEAPAGSDDEPTLHPISLNADRREYNPDSEIAFRWDWMGNKPKNQATTEPFLKLEKITDGQTTQIWPSKPLNVSSGTLLTISDLVKEMPDSDSAEAASVTLLPGDVLLLTIRFVKEKDAAEEYFKLSLALRIVAVPVIPKPDAAYALLRVEGTGAKPPIACSKFAWSPEPTRVELVSPEDLRNGLVRRRAVFLWRDAARAESVSGFSVQKIAMNGATHIPSYPQDFCPGPDRPASETATKKPKSDLTLAKVERVNAPEDNLEDINGIGPAISRALRTAGINTFRQLSEKSAAELSNILTDAGISPTVHDPASWITQASQLERV